MDFEYNGNLLEEDRVNLVANEIINKYSQVSLEKAREAARLEGRISSSKTANDELTRLYNIMLVNDDNKKLVSIIYKDFLEALKNHRYEIKDEVNKYLNLIDGINSFINYNTDFPFLSDYE